MPKMPGSIRIIDATSTRYDPEPIKDYLDSLEAIVVNRASIASIANIQFPPSPADSEVAVYQASPRESPCATTREEKRVIRGIDRDAPGTRQYSWKERPLEGGSW